VTTTPLGADVEPDVNCKNTGSVGTISGTSALDSGRLARSSTVMRSRAVGTRGITVHRIFWTCEVATTRSTAATLSVRTIPSRYASSRPSESGRIQRHRHDAGGDRAQEREDELAGVGDHQRDPVALAEPEPGELAPAPAGLIDERAEAEPPLGAVACDERVAPRVADQVGLRERVE